MNTALKHLRLQLLAAAILFAGAQAATAIEDVGSMAMEYKNTATDRACARLVWLEPSGTREVLRPRKLPESACAEQGETITVDLDELSEDRRPSRGSEFWLEIQRAGKDRVSCKKKATRFLYRLSSRDTATFKTADNGNGCTLVCKKC